MLLLPPLRPIFSPAPIVRQISKKLFVLFHNLHELNYTAPMTTQKAALTDIYSPIQEQLSDVQGEIFSILTTSNPLIGQVVKYFYSGSGKFLRPALCLLGASFGNPYSAPERRRPSFDLRSSPRHRPGCRDPRRAGRGAHPRGRSHRRFGQARSFHASRTNACGPP